MGSALQELTKKTQRLPDDLGAASQLVAQLYALRTEGFTDAHFERLEELIATSIRLLQRNPDAKATALIEQLAVALEGIQEGLPPNPELRPSKAELAERFERHAKEMGL
jgi:hypothetical protein